MSGFLFDLSGCMSGFRWYPTWGREVESVAYMPNVGNVRFVEE